MMIFPRYINETECSTVRGKGWKFFPGFSHAIMKCARALRARACALDVDVSGVSLQKTTGVSGYHFMGPEYTLFSVQKPRSYRRRRTRTDSVYELWSRTIATNIHSECRKFCRFDPKSCMYESSTSLFENCLFSLTPTRYDGHDFTDCYRKGA